MIELSALAQAAPAVTLDGPETGLYVWATTITVVFGTILTRLWVRISANEKIQSFAAMLSPKYTTKARTLATETDKFVQMLAKGEVPADQIQSLASGLSAKTLSLMSGDE